MTIETIRVDVGSYSGLGDSLKVAVDIYLPTTLAPQAALFFCIPGGGVTRRYFDLGGGPDTTFSLAHAISAGGHVVVTADPIGVGESTRPDDGFALTAEVEAELMSRAFRALRKRKVAGIDLGSLMAIGSGHSAGALISILQQTSHRDFSAMALFCFGSAGLPQYLPPEQIAALADPDRGRSKVAEFARKMFGGNGYPESGAHYDETPASRALRVVRGAILPVVGSLAMTPGNVRPEIAMINLPVFLAVGDRDMTGPPHLLAADYVACPDFTLFVVPGSGHHPFVTLAAPALYRRLLNWTQSITAAVS